MPATVAKRGDKYRVVEADTGRLVRNKQGTPVDGGGHMAKHMAKKQARAINSSSRQ